MVIMGKKINEFDRVGDALLVGGQWYDQHLDEVVKNDNPYRTQLRAKAQRDLLLDEEDEVRRNWHR